MAEYYNALKSHGAKFYEDPMMARDAVKPGLFEKEILTRPWDGF
jgi:hypothetical protein